MEHIYHNIEGFFNYSNLYDKIIDTIPNNSTFVEVGLWKGRSISYAVVEAFNKNKKIKFIGVDTFEGSPGEDNLMNTSSVINNTLYKEYLNNIKPIIGNISTIKLPSVEAASLFDDKSLDFVYIDASHNYMSVRQDINAWWPKIKIGGFMGGHDFGNADQPDGGVQRAVTEVLQGKNIQLFNLGWSSWLYEVTE